MSVYFEVGGLKYRMDAIGEKFYQNHVKRFECSPGEDAYLLNLSQAEIDAEKESGEMVSDYEAETVAALRKVVHHCLQHSRMMIHGACVAYRGVGYLFVAPSGTGKSTHISLWKEYLGDEAEIINGDKPMLSFGSSVMVHGTPWNGKEGYGCNRSVPLGAVIGVKRAQENTLTRLDFTESFQTLLCSIFESTQPESGPAVLENIGKIIEKVPVYELQCNISKEAFLCSFEGLTQGEMQNGSNIEL